MTSPQSVPRVLTLQGGVWRGCRSLTFSQGQKFQTEGEEYFEAPSERDTVASPKF